MFLRIFLKVSLEEFDINSLYCVGLPGYTWQGVPKYTANNSQTLQDEDLILKLETKIRGGLSSVLGDKYVKSSENKKLLYIDANNLYGWARSQMLPYDENELWPGHSNLYMMKLQVILNTEDDSDFSFF